MRNGTFEMQNDARKRILVLALAGALAGTAAHAATPRLRRMVVVGDSVLAGFSSGGFIARGRGGQVDSAPAFVARRARVSLPQPLMSSPGVPPQLVIDDANDNGVLDPGEVRRTNDTIGFRARPVRVARNLAIPGEDMVSVFDEIAPAVIARRLLAGETVAGRDVLKFLELGLPFRSESVSQVTRARDLRPTFLMVWIGNNDVLDMATRTDPDAAALDPSQFGSRFRRLLDELADTGADMAVGNIPDVTGVAALRHAAGEVTSCRQDDGTLRPVATDDLLSIDLERAALPVPPCADVLGPSERARIRATVMAFNAEIAAAISETEQRRGVAIAPVDLFGLFDGFRQSGFDLDGNGTADLATGYLGGLFSLDGIHPTPTANALVANAFLDAIAQRFGDTIPRVDVARVAARDPLVGNRFRPAGEAPFGLIDPADANTFENFFDGISARVSRGARNFGDDVSDLGRNVADRIKRFFRRVF